MPGLPALRFCACHHAQYPTKAEPLLGFKVYGHSYPLEGKIVPSHVISLTSDFLIQQFRGLGCSK